jgi:hypothetical protein
VSEGQVMKCLKSNTKTWRFSELLLYLQEITKNLYIMGIIHWFKNDLKKEERVLTRDLISMAIIDGEFKDEEVDEIERILKAEGISTKEMMDSLRGKDIEIPFTEEEKRDYIIHLTNIMGIDNVYSPIEAHLLETLGKRVGYNQMQIISIILSAIRNNWLTNPNAIDMLDDFVGYLTTTSEE